MYRKLLTSMLAALSLLGALSMFGGCTAVEKTGEAMEHGGQKLQNEANEHR